MRTVSKKTVDEFIRLQKELIRDITYESAHAVTECARKLSLEIYGDDCRDSALSLLFMSINGYAPLKKLSDEEIYKLLEFFDIEVVKED